LLTHTVQLWDQQFAYPMGTWGFPLQVNWPGHDANQAPDVKDVHNSTLTPPCMSWCLKQITSILQPLWTEEYLLLC